MTAEGQSLLGVTAQAVRRHHADSGVQMLDGKLGEYPNLLGDGPAGYVPGFTDRVRVEEREQRLLAGWLNERR